MATIIARRPVAAATPPPLVPLERALALLLDAVSPVRPTRLPLREAEDLILSEPLVAPSAVPARALALRAGWALRAADTDGASSYLPVRLSVAPTRVRAGDDLPAGADCVVAEDAVAAAADGMAVLDQAAPGQWTRRPGGDAGAGLVLRPAGRFLRALDVAVGRAAGVETCAVRRPILRIEIADASAHAALAADLIASLARRRGASVESFDAGGTPDATPLVVAIGDPAAGLAANAAAGGQVLARRIALEPGSECAVGVRGSSRIVFVSSRPADVLSVWLALVVPALSRLSAGLDEQPSMGRLARKISSTVGLAEMALLRRDGGTFVPIGTGDLTLAALAAADHWLILPPDSEGHPPGAEIAAMTL